MKSGCASFYMKRSRFKLAEPTGFEPATSDVTGQSVSSHFQAVAFTVSKLQRLVPTLGVTECHAPASFTGIPTAQ